MSKIGIRDRGSWSVFARFATPEIWVAVRFVVKRSKPTGARKPGGRWTPSRGDWIRTSDPLHPMQVVETQVPVCRNLTSYVNPPLRAQSY